MFQEEVGSCLSEMIHFEKGLESLIRDDPLREGAGSRLSEMIHFGKADVTYKVSDPLPIFIKEDPAF